MEFEFLLDQAISSVFTRHRQSDLGKKSKDRFKGIHNMCHSQKKKKFFFSLWDILNDSMKRFLDFYIELLLLVSKIKERRGESIIFL